jgi:hypothetical protein
MGDNLDGPPMYAQEEENVFPMYRKNVVPMYAEEKLPMYGEKRGAEEIRIDDEIPEIAEPLDKRPRSFIPIVVPNQSTKRKGSDDYFIGDPAAISYPTPIRPKIIPNLINSQSPDEQMREYRQSQSDKNLSTKMDEQLRLDLKHKNDVLLNEALCVNISTEDNGEQWVIDPITNFRISGHSISHYILKSNTGSNFCFDLLTLAKYLLGSEGPSESDINSLILDLFTNNARGNNSAMDETFWKFSILDGKWIIYVTVKEFIDIFEQYRALTSQDGDILSIKRNTVSVVKFK